MSFQGSLLGLLLPQHDAEGATRRINVIVSVCLIAYIHYTLEEVLRM